eukprot:1148441-Pelagomonas_calceolata.AAC.6
MFYQGAHNNERNVCAPALRATWVLKLTRPRREAQLCESSFLTHQGRVILPAAAEFTHMLWHSL